MGFTAGRRDTQVRAPATAAGGAPGGARSPRVAETTEEFRKGTDRGGVEDEGDQPQPTAAGWTGQHVQGECARHQLGQVQPRPDGRLPGASAAGEPVAGAPAPGSVSTLAPYATTAARPRACGARRPWSKIRLIRGRGMRAAVPDAEWRRMTSSLMRAAAAAKSSRPLHNPMHDMT